MIAAIGHGALWLALLAALLLGSLPLAGAARSRAAWMRAARPLAMAHAALLALAFASLVAALVQLDFSLAYVVAHAHQALPRAYRVAAAWGGHEGSMLLWVLMLAGWTLAVALRPGALPAAMHARTLAVLGWVGAGFALFLLLTSDPFAPSVGAPRDGRDLNPLLQDAGMLLHPPLLYMGYVGFAVAFAFAVAALIGGQADAAWARWTRPWTTTAWAFLTLGIALGSWWAYGELGWGGWWFWDPVENASLMPWLAGTALIHSLAVTEKRGALTAWTLLLALLAFALSLLGAFLVRSGVLSSVHAFASDPARGLFILVLLAALIGPALALYAWRAPRLAAGGRFDAVSRESVLLLNNVLLLVAAASVLLGTLYPLALDAFGLAAVSVGPPYFETLLLPLFAALAVLLGIGPLAKWKRADLPALWQRLRWAALAALLAGLSAAVVAERLSIGAALGVALALWIAAGIAIDARATPRPARAQWGMWLAHLGVAAFALGMALAGGEQQRDVRLAVGESVELGGLRFTFWGVRPLAGPNFEGVQGLVEVASGERSLARLLPEKRVYRVQRQPMTEAAIDAGLARDLYVSLGQPLAGGAWTLRLAVKPFVRWIWGGCALMALGGLVAASDRRYRRGARRDAALAPAAVLEPSA
ncbi:heme lyase CcmF/NrfE family subunit [Caldimonas sp. KR1-144]|uniref:heme lyase CcmF/NrfE family subunit n=1 Tax=Caldimonas sp. KR1-144 TaxID=3400911 RepID=UPI003C000869